MLNPPTRTAHHGCMDQWKNSLNTHSVKTSMLGYKSFQWVKNRQITSARKPAR